MLQSRMIAGRDASTSETHRPAIGERNLLADWDREKCRLSRCDCLLQKTEQMRGETLAKRRGNHPGGGRQMALLT